MSPKVCVPVPKWLTHVAGVANEKSPPWAVCRFHPADVVVGGAGVHVGSSVGVAAIVGATVAAVAVIGVLLLFAAQPDMVVAFRSLPATDAAQITQKLKDGRIPYELADNGATIKVPGNQAQDVKLQMAAAGLPQGGTIGWEIF
ncbi:MAG: hypothetical protein ABR611_16625, partial [Chthoniobacterales bacterium]